MRPARRGSPDLPSADPAPGNDEPVSRWQRPHRPDIGMVVAAALLGFGALFALAVTVALLTLGGGSPGPTILAVYAFVAVVLVAGWRFFQVGVYVSGTALRIRHLLRTRTLPWSDIDEVLSRPARLWGRATLRQAIWVVPRGQDPVEIPVQLADDTAARGMRKKGARVLGPIEYQETLQLLRRRTAAGR
jgi:hypothetical protein